MRGLIHTIFLLALVSPVHASVRDQIFDIVEAVSTGEKDELLPGSVRAPTPVEAFYHQRDYELVWDDFEQIRRLLDLLGKSDEHGLTPDNYHYTNLRALAAEWQERLLRRDRIRAQFDVLLTDAVFIYARHMMDGKVNPSSLESSWNYTRSDFSLETVTQKLRTSLKDKTLIELLRDMEPKFEFYRQLQAELLRYRQMEQAGEFSSVPEDTVLKPGMLHQNIPALRNKLRQIGLSNQVNTDDELLFDDALVDSVKSFQEMHSLEADGVVGQNSFRELNRSYAQRIDQLRINLDRVRWINNDVGDDLVLVNIAGFEMYFVRDNALVWEADVMVGSIRHKTPLFRSRIKYLVLNPTWTVPPGIKRRSIYPKFSKDPNYPVEHHYKLYDGDGAEVDPLSIDYSQYPSGRLPFRVVQQPGPDNALGQVKFIFPNQYSVFLHDTPARALFSRSSRAFSSGCIRVRDPLLFAEVLLDDEENWSQQHINEVIDGGKTKVVHLEEPMDVMLMYWTASPTADGRIQFHADIYDRDAKAIAALGAEPNWAVN